MLNKKEIRGKVKEINICIKKGETKPKVSKATFIKNFGIEGDCHGGKKDREVSLLAVETMESISRGDSKGLCTSKFVQNITTEGIKLHELPVGTELKIGETTHEITMVGKECFRECTTVQQGGVCALSSEVVFTKVITGGDVYPEDFIKTTN